jgi:hypothetical protein
MRRHYALLLSLNVTLVACMSRSARPAQDPAGEGLPRCPEQQASLPADGSMPGSYDSGPGPKIGDSPSAVVIPTGDCVPAQEVSGR